MAVTAGPATGTAEILCGTPPTTGIEVQVPLGLPSLSPSSAPFLDPGIATTVNASNAINKAGVWGQITNPC
jgi:hypothetical protein